MYDAPTYKSDSLRIDSKALEGYSKQQASGTLSDGDNPRYAYSAVDFECLPEACTLVPTLSSSCLRRCLTIAFVFAACVLGDRSALADTCKITAAYTPSEADVAFFHSDYDRAVTLYQAQLAQKPGDPALIASLAQVFLRQQKVKEADDIVQKALAQNPQSAILLTSLGEIQYREGTPWLAGASAKAAEKADVCYPAGHLLSAKVLRLNSYYGTAAKEIATAHTLDPHNPMVRRSWLDTLPIKDRIAELESYLATGGGDDAETTKSLHFFLDYLKQQVAQPHNACRLVSNTETATIPFAPLMSDGTHIHAFGLEVKFNDHNARLQIDTGASGLVISRSVADHAGLKQFSQIEIGGVGSQGRKSAYTAFADDIKIGSLEFRDCRVEVIDQRNVVDIDGLIGMDVFSRFLITLDYPMRKLLLAALPRRPDDAGTKDLTLKTTRSEDDDDSPDGTDAAKTAAPKPAPSGPRDRYIAPEMKDWVPVYRIGHSLLLPASLNKTEQKMFILDTGAFSTTISPDVARVVTKVHANDSMKVRGLSGTVDKVYTADAITFQFANISQKVEDVVAFDTSSLSKNLNMEVSGLIGYTALAHLTINIDYRDGLMKFAYDPNRGFKPQQ
jgi:predicted aspartyl protease/tetratricopeptide (TPR) repeat protein